MNKYTVAEYHKLRRKGWHAKEALRAARIKDEWLDAESEGFVKLDIVADDCVSLDGILGDCYDPKVITDISPKRLAAQRKLEIERINRDGVWGIVGKVKVPACSKCHSNERWETVESIWGFVGDDWKNSGHDTDVMSAVLTARKKIAW